MRFPRKKSLASLWIRQHIVPPSGHSWMPKKIISFYLSILLSIKSPFEIKSQFMSCFISFSIPTVPLCLQRQMGRLQVLRLHVPPNFSLSLRVQNSLRAKCVLKWEKTEVLRNWTRYAKRICPDVQLRRTRPGEADRWWQVKKPAFLAAALLMCRLLCQVLRWKQWPR